MNEHIGVWIGSESRTCLVLRSTSKKVYHVSFNPSGVRLKSVDTPQFLASYRRLNGYPVAAAARRVLDFGARFGITVEAEAELRKVIPSSKEEETMTTKKTGTVTVKVHPPPKSKKKSMNTQVQKAVTPAKAGEFINRALLDGGTTETIYKNCVQLYPGFGPKQRNTINVYRHRLRKAGQLK